MQEWSLLILCISETFDLGNLERLIRADFANRLLWELIDCESHPEGRLVQCVATAVDSTPHSLQALLNLETVRYSRARLQSLPGLIRSE